MQYIIGLGHKARNGKDTFASTFSNIFHKEGVAILHFADALYKECENKDNPRPLIIRTDSKFLVWDCNINEYKTVMRQDDAELDDLFSKRDIEVYDRMIGKDPEILQWWGTGFRRNRFNSKYWVNKIKDEINKCNSKYIFIPDTRFKNELKFLKSVGGLYIDIARIKSDGHQYIDPQRNPTHPSEIELDGVRGFRNYEFKDGDFEAITKEVINLNKDLNDER